MSYSEIGIRNRYKARERRKSGGSDGFCFLFLRKHSSGRKSAVLVEQVGGQRPIVNIWHKAGILGRMGGAQVFEELLRGGKGW